MLALLLALALSPALTPQEQQLSAVAQDIARDAGLDLTVIVTVPEQWRDRGVASASTYQTKDIVAILVSPILVDEMDAEGMRGLLGHELGHTQNHCGPEYASESEKLACEHQADDWSAQHVGYRAAVRGLCQLMYIAFEWRYTTDASPLIDRVKLLHRQDPR